VTSHVGVHGVRQTTDKSVVLDVLLLNERLDPFMKLSLVPMTMTISREMANRPMALPRKRIVIVMWAGRRARVRRIDRDNTLLRNGLRGDHRVRKTVTFFHRR